MPTAIDIPILQVVAGPWQQQTPPIVGVAGNMVDALNTQTTASSLDLWPVSRNVHEVFEFDLNDAQFPGLFYITAITLRFSHTRSCTGGLRIWTCALDDNDNLIDGIREALNYDQNSGQATVTAQARTHLADGSRWTEHTRVGFQIQHGGLYGGSGSSHLLHWVTADIEYESGAPTVAITAPTGTALEFPSVDWTYTHEAPQAAVEVQIRTSTADLSRVDADAWWHKADYIAGSNLWVDRIAGYKMQVFGAPTKDGSGNVQFTHTGGEYGLWPSGFRPNGHDGETNTLLALLTNLDASADRAIVSSRSEPGGTAPAGQVLYMSSSTTLDGQWANEGAVTQLTSSTGHQLSVEHLVGMVTGATELKSYSSFTGFDGTPETRSASGSPTFEDSTASSTNTGQTTHTVNLPATVNEGDKLVAYLMFNSDKEVTRTAGPEFIQIAHQHGSPGTFDIWVLPSAAGTEGGGTVTFSTDANNAGAFIVDRWSGCTPGLVDGTDYALAVGSYSNTTTPNPPSLDIPWASANNAVTALFGARGDNETASAYPTSYTNGVSSASTNPGGGGASVGRASRITTNDPEDPAAFTITGTEYVIAATLAFAPATGGDFENDTEVVEVGRHQFGATTWVGSMALGDLLLYQDQELTAGQLTTLKTELQTAPGDPGPTGEIIWQSGKLITTNTRSVAITSPLEPGDYRAWVRVWSLFPNGLEIPSQWHSGRFTVDTPPAAYGAPDSVVHSFSSTTGAVTITIAPPLSGPIGNTILLQRSDDDGLSWSHLAYVASNGSNPVNYTDAYAPFQTACKYRAQFTSSDNHPPSTWVTTTTYRTDNQEWWLIDPTALSYTVNPVPRDAQVEEFRSATISRQRGSATAATSGGLGHDFTLEVWLKNKAEREAMAAILDRPGALRLVDILGQEYFVTVSGSITKQLQRTAPTPGETTGLRDLWSWRIPLVEVASPAT